jgi:hypothetical protein
VLIARVARPLILTLAIPAAAVLAAGSQAAATSSQASFGAAVAMDQYSPNWGGYVASGSTFRSVRATFKVPALNCVKTPGTTKNPALVGEWVGLDTATVEQDGISGQCTSGHEQYSAWYEMYPKTPVYPTMTVSQGDVIQVSVRYAVNKHEYELILKDLSNGEGFTKWARCGKHACANSSAEVITESPGRSVAAKTAYYPLADSGTTSFTGISITDGTGQSGTFTSPGWQTSKFVMQDGSGRVKAAISGLTRNGSAFRTYWERET